MSDVGTTLTTSSDLFRANLEDRLKRLQTRMLRDTIDLVSFVKLIRCYRISKKSAEILESKAPKLEYPDSTSVSASMQSFFQKLFQACINTYDSLKDSGAVQDLSTIAKYLIAATSWSGDPIMSQDWSASSHEKGLA